MAQRCQWWLNSSLYFSCIFLNFICGFIQCFGARATVGATLGCAALWTWQILYKARAQPRPRLGTCRILSHDQFGPWLPNAVTWLPGYCSGQVRRLIYQRNLNNSLNSCPIWWPKMSSESYNFPLSNDSKGRMLSYVSIWGVLYLVSCLRLLLFLPRRHHFWSHHNPTTSSRRGFSIATRCKWLGRNRLTGHGVMEFLVVISCFLPFSFNFWRIYSISFSLSRILTPPLISHNRHFIFCITDVINVLYFQFFSGSPPPCSKCEALRKRWILLLIEHCHWLPW
jgi:hypothetical protein